MTVGKFTLKLFCISCKARLKYGVQNARPVCEDCHEQSLDTDL